MKRVRRIVTALLLLGGPMTAGPASAGESDVVAKAGNASISQKQLDRRLVLAKMQVVQLFCDLPIPDIHPGSDRAAEAGRCAAEQGKF